MDTGFSSSAIDFTASRMAMVMNWRTAPRFIKERDERLKTFRTKNPEGDRKAKP